MNFKSPEFKKLQKEWYKKLAKSGFVDIEQNEYELKNPATGAPFTAEETIQYYKLASAYLENTDFETLNEKLVWFLHSQGETGRTIGTALNKSASYVSRIIAKHEERMLK